MSKLAPVAKKIKTTWYIWLFPAFAICICAWLFFNYLSEKGPRITISFEDGGNIQPEKTQVRFRGVPIGVVRKMQISENQREVIAFVDLQKNAEHFAIEGSKFWVVLPKVSLQGVTGLETILEGPYIAVTPGRDHSKEKKEFKGRIGAELIDPQEDTSTYILETKNADSLNVGDPVTFRGMKVGSISKVVLSQNGQSILVNISLQNKYVHLIRNNTVFWRKMAVQASLGLFKSEVKISSFESLLKGGIDFFTPTEVGPKAKALHKFSLSDGPPKGWEKWNPTLE